MMPEVSSQNDPEQGFLLRLRTWRDALPWLSVVDCLRPAASVVSLALIGVTAGLALLVADGMGTRGEASLIIGPLPIIRDLPTVVREALTLIWGPAIELLQRRVGWSELLWMLLHQLVLVVLWAVPAAYVIRQSGLAMAGRLTMGSVEGLRLVAGRVLPMIVVPLIPTVVLLATALYFFVAGLVGQIPSIGYALEVLLQILGIPLAIAGGLVGFAGLFAVPLAWAAIALEQDGNAFDGISRGYEYVLRRPLQAVLYAVIAVVVLVVLAQLAEGVAAVAIATGWGGLAAGAEGDREPGGPLFTVLTLLPTVAVLTAGWSLVAWMYLLLRRSANHQEIEDVWEHARGEPEPLPELKV